MKYITRTYTFTNFNNNIFNHTIIYFINYKFFHYSSVSSDIILNTVVWSDDTNLFVIWMNRIQNESSLVHYLVSDSAEIKNVSSIN